MKKRQCKITVLRKELYPDLQRQYLADPESGPCPIFEVGQEFLLERSDARDDFWHMLDGKFCSEAWDCISRYVYTALQGGSIMDGWTKDEKVMIACCNDGTRPVIFKIERLDGKEQNKKERQKSCLSFFADQSRFCQMISSGFLLFRLLAIKNLIRIPCSQNLRSCSVSIFPP